LRRKRNHGEEESIKAGCSVFPLEGQREKIRNANKPREQGIALQQIYFGTARSAGVLDNGWVEKHGIHYTLLRVL
jgi:hypothetical protein